jgi:hypothetical protein
VALDGNFSINSVAIIISSSLFYIIHFDSRLGPEADHSLPSGAEVKKAWSYTSTVPYVFMAWYLVKHRDSFTFTFVALKGSYFQWHHPQVKVVPVIN